MATHLNIFMDMKMPLQLWHHNGSKNIICCCLGLILAIIPLTLRLFRSWEQAPVKSKFRFQLLWK